MNSLLALLPHTRANLRILAILVCMLSTAMPLGLVTHADDHVASLPEPLQQLQQLQLSESVAGDFRQQKTLQDLPFPLHSSGTFQFSSRQGLDWHILEPIDSQIHISRNRIIQRQGDEVLFQMGSQQSSAIEMISGIFLAVLSGDMEALSEYFTMDASLDVDVWTLELQPRNDVIARVAENITLRGRRHIESVRLRESRGDITEIWFENHTP